MAIPEYIYPNQEDNLKDQDKDLLVSFLSKQEEEQKLKMEQSQENLNKAPAQGKPPGKGDPKKDPKGAPA